MNEWLLGCRPRADCCLASLSGETHHFFFTRASNALRDREKAAAQHEGCSSLPPSVHPWLVLFLALAALLSLFPLYRTHAAAESVMPAAAFPLPPAAAPPAKERACLLGTSLPISAWERMDAVDRPRPPGWLQFLRNSKPGRRGRCSESWTEENVMHLSAGE